MKKSISDFEKKKKFLVCIDSDGCAMDTMEVKHKECFGPLVVEVWDLFEIEDKFLEVWNEVNLYSKSRGINRFEGVVTTFEYLAAEGVDMPDISALAQWVEKTDELSNPALERAIDETAKEELVLALKWSKKVNEAVNDLESDQPFSNVKEVLEDAAQSADIAIVSSANSKAVYEEWTRHDLAPYVEVMLGQEAGSKADCISSLKEKGYGKDKVLMVGDALGDLNAAMENGSLFYPILVKKEDFAWERLGSEALDKFLVGSYQGEYQKERINEFKALLES